MRFMGQLMNFSSEPEPCPCEEDTPATSPGPVKDGETVVRFVQIKEHVDGDASGRVFLRPTAVSKQDLSGRGDHSFSLVREAHIEENDFDKRAIAKTISDEWKSDPVIARVPTAHLRAILDDKGRREICVNSDPTTAKDDRLGACPAHAAALRSDPPKDKQRPAWLVLQAKVGECFEDIHHLDGSAVSPDPAT